MNFWQDLMIVSKGKAFMESEGATKVGETRPWLGGVRLSHVDTK